MQRYVRRYGIPAGLVLLIAFGPSGWLLNSTAFEVLAGMGLMLIIVSYKLHDARAR
jgi:hypothetical protein